VKKYFKGFAATRRGGWREMILIFDFFLQKKSKIKIISLQKVFFNPTF
jgi:hypothetical protein